MGRKSQMKERLRGKVIAVVRAKNQTLGYAMSKTMIENGISTIEVTFSVPNADELIKKLKTDFPQAIIGAGTVLNLEDAKKAYDSHCDFIVAPCIVEEVAMFCRDKDIFCCLGAATATESFQAHKLGSDVIKLFPGECIPSKMIRSFRAPMPFLEFMPTGGVDHTNITQWFEDGAFAVGIGGYLSKDIDETNLPTLAERCKKLLGSL